MVRCVPIPWPRGVPANDGLRRHSFYDKMQESMNGQG